MEINAMGYNAVTKKCEIIVISGDLEEFPGVIDEREEQGVEKCV